MTVKILIRSKCHLQFLHIPFLSSLIHHFFPFFITIYFIHYDYATILIPWEFYNIFVISEWLVFIVNVVFGMVTIICAYIMLKLTGKILSFGETNSSTFAATDSSLTPKSRFINLILSINEWCRPYFKQKQSMS